MRIMVHCTEYGAPWNEGTKNIARCLVEHLRARGDDVLVTARRVTSDDGDAIPIGEGHVSTFALAGAVARANGVQVIHSIQSLSPLTGARCLALARASRAHTVLHVTGLGPIARSLGARLAADRVVVGSPWLRRYFPDADVVYPVPGVADISPLGPPPASGDPVVAFLGAFEPGRGVETLLAAGALLRDRGVRFRLKIAWNGVGGGEGRERVTAAARQHGIELDIAGTVDTRRFYGDAHVVVIPRVSHTRMSLPLRIVECALLQRPVVVAKILGMDDVVGDMGAGFVPGDARSLADALEPLVADPVRWEACRAAAERRRSEFLPEVMLGQLERVYASLGS